MPLPRELCKAPFEPFGIGIIFFTDWQNNFRILKPFKAELEHGAIDLIEKVFAHLDGIVGGDVMLICKNRNLEKFKLNLNKVIIPNLHELGFASDGNGLKWLGLYFIAGEDKIATRNRNSFRLDRLN